MTVAGAHFRRGGDLPWGWWLLAEDGRLRDEDGRVWSSVREAFWEGALGMASAHIAREQQELLLRVLTSVDAGWLGVESRLDLFGGDMLFWRFYLCWLGSIGLTDPGRGSALEAPLSDEGRAVLLMLRATRSPEWVDLPIRDLVAALARAGRGEPDAARERALRAFESGLTPLPHLFARETVGDAHLVTLTSLDLRERMPVRRRSWSASFADERHRDDLFAWLAERVHRWEDWGGIARSRGAAALSAHLLSLLVASPIPSFGDHGRGGS